MSVVLTTKTIKLGNKETIKTRKEVRKIRTWKRTERRIGVTQWSLISAVGAERGRSRISNIYILLSCRFFIAISNAPKQIGKRIEVSKDFTLSSIRRSSVTKIYQLFRHWNLPPNSGGVKHKNSCTKQEIKYKHVSKYKRTGESREGKKILETANHPPHNPPPPPPPFPSPGLPLISRYGSGNEKEARMDKLEKDLNGLQW